MPRTHPLHLPAALFLLLFAAMPAAGAEVVERFDRTYDLSASGTVSVENVNGAVVVSGWDRPQVRVEAVKKVRSGSRERAREAMERIEIRVTSGPGGIDVETDVPRGSGGLLSWLFGNEIQGQVEYALSVPRGARVDVDTVNGRVEIREVEGAVTVDTTNGAVVVSGARGPVEAGTTNGAIRAELAALDGGHPVRLSTTNGAIRLALPREARMTVDASTTNGGIELLGLPEAEVTSRGRRHLRAHLGSGGPEIRLTTTNGGIKIEGR